jgi:hypothetical protein
VSIMGAEEEGEGEEGYEGQAWEGNGGKFQGLGGGTEHLEESLPGLGGKAQRPSTAKRPRPTAAAGGGEGGQGGSCTCLGAARHRSVCFYVCIYVVCTYVYLCGVCVLCLSVSSDVCMCMFVDTGIKCRGVCCLFTTLHPLGSCKMKG